MLQLLNTFFLASFVILFALSSNVFGDHVKVTTLGCKAQKTFKLLTPEITKDPLLLEQFAIANGCKVLRPTFSIQIIEENVSFYKIVEDNTQQVYFVRKNALQKERSGDKNSFSF